MREILVWPLLPNYLHYKNFPNIKIAHFQYGETSDACVCVPSVDREYSLIGRCIRLASPFIDCVSRLCIFSSLPRIRFLIFSDHQIKIQ